MDSRPLKICVFNCSERSNQVGAYDGSSCRVNIKRGSAVNGAPPCSSLEHWGQ